jgi:hypothetical protein
MSSAHHWYHQPHSPPSYVTIGPNDQLYRGEYMIEDWSDGNDKYTHYPNVWLKYQSQDVPQGKVKLRNKQYQDVVIPSISDWKTRLIRS